MKIFTDKAYREQLEKIQYERDRERYIHDRLDRLSEDLRKLEWRVQALEGNCNPVPVATCDPEKR